MLRAARGRVLAVQEQRKAEVAKQERERVEQARWSRVQELERMLAMEEEEERVRRRRRPGRGGGQSGGVVADGSTVRLLLSVSR